MRNDHQRIIPIILCGILSALVMVACNTTSDPVGPSSTIEFSGAIGVALDCPTFNEACSNIAALVRQRCPSVGDYRNYGQENSCVRRLIGRELDHLEDCFSPAELTEIQACVRFDLMPNSENERYVIPRSGE